MNDGHDAVAWVENGRANGPVVLVCEHASNHIPAEFDGLGLSPETATSHAAWDPGAADTARALAARLDAPLVLSGISRLVHDCNRPPASPEAMPARVDAHDVPGNAGLDAAERDRRAALFYRPFEALVRETLEAHPDAALVTVHSFNPVYGGARRAVEIGILHDTDSRLADAILAAADGPYRVERNEPYGPADNVMHTLNHHGVESGRSHAMIEIRNDLIADETSCEDMAALLSGWLHAALAGGRTAGVSA